MIKVTNLTKKYGANTVVNSLNFEIEKGKIYGFLGPNGAGKSTTMNMITGCLSPNNGQVLIDGIDIFDDPINAKKKIGYLPENPPVYPDMTPYEYLMFVAEAKKVPSRKREDQVLDVMEETNILSVKDRLIKNLSKGFRQRVGIAQAMLGDPQVIILDEPTVGLDPKQITEIRELISRLGKTRTVILSSHILAEVSAVCDHVMIINRGKLIASDTLENIRRDNSPENLIKMTVKANSKELEKILDGVDGINAYEYEESCEGSSFLDVSVECEAGADIRDALFYALSEKKILIRSFTKACPSLEEIFLKLTDAGYSEDGEEYDEEYDGEDEEYDEDETDEDEDDDYVPLFSGNIKEDED